MGYDYDDDTPRGSALVPRQEGQRARSVVDLSTTISIVGVIVLAAIYVLSPVDAVPDVLPVAGQADDLAAILAGGGSVAFLTALRFILRAMVTSRIGRIGCAIVFVLAAIGAVAVFWLLLELLGAIF
ncbi:MAG: DUF1232 domain-containing protein [Chloroflexi bacterium]|jgi:hypothetical protein|nr:DUF1232 domain-containing protein [Chloroflexota bacterium]